MRGEELARIEVLLGESWRARYENPREMVYLAELAVAVAGTLAEHGYDPRAAADVCCRAAAELGNAYRLTDHLDRAERTLEAAVVWFRRGTGDLRLLAVIAERFSSLLWHRRRTPEALALLDRLYGFYGRAGDRHAAGRILLSAGVYTEHEGDRRVALLLTCEGLRLLDHAREPELSLAGVHNALCCAVGLRRFVLARKLIPAVRPLYAGRELNALRLRWLEGLLAAGMGERAAAEAAYHEVREGFLSANLLFPASLVSLDLALLFAEVGKARKVAAIAEELIGSFRSLHVGREALVSLMLLKAAAEKDRATAEALGSRIQETVHALRRYMHTR